jgi:hypothetical protein
MTLAELLALVGRAWARLLLYPGGLSVLAVLWGLSRINAGHKQANPANRIALEYSIAALALAWLGVALLPLPLVAPLGRPVDMLVLVALLEWPRLVAAHAEARQGDTRRLAAAFNSYPLLLAATLLLAWASGSLEAGAWSNLPAAGAPERTRAAYWLGALGWLAALPALAGIGPFRADPPCQVLLRFALQVRATGFVALALLPWVAWAGALSPWLVPVPVLGLAVAIWVFDRATQRFGTRRWALGSFWLALVLLAALAVFSAGSLAERLS